MDEKSAKSEVRSSETQRPYHRPPEWRNSLRWNLATQAMKGLLEGSASRAGEIQALTLEEAASLAESSFRIAEAMIRRNKKYNPHQYDEAARPEPLPSLPYPPEC